MLPARTHGSMISGGGKPERKTDSCQHRFFLVYSLSSGNICEPLAKMFQYCDKFTSIDLLQYLMENVKKFPVLKSVLKYHNEQTPKIT